MSKTSNKHFQLYFNQFEYASNEEKDFIAKDLGLITLKKGDCFLKAGKTQDKMGFISEGLIRRFYINEKGNKITTGFTKELEFVTDYPAFIRQIPTKYFLQCLEPTTIVTLPYQTIQDSYSKFKNSDTQGRLIAEKVLTILSDRVESFLFNTAEERYLKFISENPDLLQRISLTHLSSFLGIERQSLSRIRKNIVQK
ncbi:Crp/Fnr family transcriptional regulator [Mesoflavibacter sp. CH_XMU1404-2]|uniref:Crp/Fnr family transcriptional regulator n=1 Tax=Mesoflavibacter sp. CH_XMU1404-2 TaxID=3107766 RepID=UPI00300AF36A